MKKSVLVAALIVAGAGSVGATVAAMTLTGMGTSRPGWDQSLYAVTSDVIATCALANTISYAGGGSAAGRRRW